MPNFLNKFIFEPLVINSNLTFFLFLFFLPFYNSTNVFAIVGGWLLSHNCMYVHMYIFECFTLLFVITRL